MNEHQKHFADDKNFIQFYFIYMKLQNRQNQSKRSSLVARLPSAEILTGNRNEGILGIMEKFYILIKVVVIYGCTHLTKFIDLYT